MVEIAREGAVERVYFRKPACYRMLSQDARDRVRPGMSWPLVIDEGNGNLKSKMASREFVFDSI